MKLACGDSGENGHDLQPVVQGTFNGLSFIQTVRPLPNSPASHSVDLVNQSISPDQVRRQ